MYTLTFVVAFYTDFSLKKSGWWQLLLLKDLVGSFRRAAANATGVPRTCLSPDQGYFSWLL